MYVTEEESQEMRRPKTRIINVKQKSEVYAKLHLVGLAST